jgi:hypothetical protein
MDARSAQIATICECIDHCFAYAMWCEEFAAYVDPEDLVMGLDRAYDLVSDSTRLHSFLALRKLDDFLGNVRPKPDDLIAQNFGIDLPSVLGSAGDKFLSQTERDNANKQVAHLTERLSPEKDSEVDLDKILTRSMPVFTRLVTALREADTSKEATFWLDRTETLIKLRRDE